MRSDGWINGIKVYDRKQLKRIAEAMARKAAEPARHVNQGFHNTSLTQCFLRQQLEVHPDEVMEMVASVATAGKATVGAGQHGKLVTVDHKSLSLDLEARWTNDDLSTQGTRDAVGQLYDLVVTQAIWDENVDEQWQYVYTQDVRPKQGTSGEHLYKLDKRSGNRVESSYDGPRLTVRDAFRMARLFDVKHEPILAHSSVVQDLGEASISNTQELLSRAQTFQDATKLPFIAIVFAGSLPGSGAASQGYDLHAVTGWISDEQFFIESRWGQSFDLQLNGVTAEEMLSAMRLPDPIEPASEAYEESGPVYLRSLDPGHPCPVRFRAPQFQQARRQHDSLMSVDRQAQSNPSMVAQQKYNEELANWEAQKAEHMAIFGDDLPFNVPPPRPSHVD